MPLIVRRPGVIEAGAVSDVPVIGHDLYATIVEMAGEGTAPGPAQDSRSLLPLLEGRAAEAPGHLYWYYPHYSPQAKQPGAAIRSGAWKLIEHYDPPGVELYNLADDPGERNDLAWTLPRQRQSLLGRLHELLADAGTKMHRPNPSHRR